MTKYRRSNQPPRFYWGRVVSLAGAAGLCVSFFLPQVEDVVPNKWCLGTVDDLCMLVSFGLPFLAAILLLPLLAFRAVPRVDGVPGVGKFLAWAVCAICLSVMTFGLGWMTLWLVSVELPTSVISTVYTVPAVTGVSLALAIVALVRSRLPRKAAAAQCALGASCLAYFTFFTGDSSHAGLWISLAASGVLAIGSAIDWFQCRPARKW